MIELATEKGFLETVINLVFLLQQIYQGLWMKDGGLLNVPWFNTEIIKDLNQNHKIKYLT
jgi:hypothetical protein